MTEESALIKDVREWLERGGFVLEMQVARVVAARTNIVLQATRYTDSLTGKQREIDVMAFLLAPGREDPLHALNLSIECKSTSAPWVAFQGSGEGNGPYTPRRFMDSETCELCACLLEAYWNLLQRNPEAYAMTEKRNKNAPDMAYEAVQQAASAAMGLVEEETSPPPDGHSEDSRQITHLTVPMVVTTSPLLVCSLDEEGEPILTEVERLVVEVYRQDVPTGYDGVSVLVVTMAHLEGLLDDLESMLQGCLTGDHGATPA